MTDDDRPRDPLPLGVIQEWRWRELRVRDLVLASNRYATEDLLDTPENRARVGAWMEEGHRHLQWLLVHRGHTGSGNRGPKCVACIGVGWLPGSGENCRVCGGTGQKKKGPDG